MTGRKYPYGNQLKEALDTLPPAVDVRICDQADKAGLEGHGPHALEVELVRKRDTSAKAAWAHLVSLTSLNVPPVLTCFLPTSVFCHLAGVSPSREACRASKGLTP